MSQKDIPADVSPDDPGNTRWLSYDELAEISGIKRDSVIRLVRRRKWPKREGNTGEVRVAIPADVLADIRSRKELLEAAQQVPSVPDMTQTVNLLQAAIGTFREQLAATQARLDRAEAATERERQAREQDGRTADAREARLMNQIAILTALVAQETSLPVADPAPEPAPPPTLRGFLLRLLRR